MGVFWFMSIQYEKVEKIDIPGYKRKMFHVSNLTVNTESESIGETINGNSFLYFMNDWQYGHVMQDVIGHYEFLRQFVPDLRLIIFSQNKRDSESGKLITPNSVVDNIIERYPDCIFANDKDKILIKNIYYLFVTFMDLIRTYDLETNDIIHYESDEDFNYQIWAARFIAEKFKPKDPVKPTRKIYISRSIADKTYEVEYLSYYKRIRVLENSKLLEDYLESIGYEIILNENLSLDEQAKLYQSASHVITINGTGAYNTIFCKPETNIIFLNIHTEFDWFFDRLTYEVTSNNVLQLPKIHKSFDYDGHAIVVEQLIECLKTIEDKL